ncbi:MAG: capsular biosynthesis protein [Spirochaetales bacterium]|nr:capsular biosynthesis protein [Spirochaetales bacterium]
MTVAKTKRLGIFIVPLFLALLATGSTPITSTNLLSSRRTEPDTVVSTLTMVFSGDIMAHDVNLSRRPYKNIYAGIRKYLAYADLRFANLEFVVDPASPNSGYPRFNAPPKYVSAALDAGFNVLSLANNHSHDIGAASMLQTLRSVALLGIGRDIYYNGIHFQPEEQFTQTIIRRNGCKIGFLAVTSFLNKLVTDERVNVVPFYRKWAEEALIDRVQALAKEVDVFVLSYHGGVEYAREIPAWKRLFFRRLVQAGVDILWSHHPHVVQTWETLEFEGSQKLILYSTGNLISGQTWNINPADPFSERLGTGEGALFYVELILRDGGWRIVRTHAVPIANYQDPDYGMVVVPFKDLPSMKISDIWKQYYRDRYEELKGKLIDTGSWGFDL